MTSIQVPTLGDQVAENLLKRFSDLGILNSKPLVSPYVPSIPLVRPEPVVSPTDATALETNIKAQEIALKEAIDNQKYYIDQAAKTGKLWFMNPKRFLQYSEFVFCTPEMAEDLQQRNIANRNKTASYIDSLARDMFNGRWLQTAESISIDLYGIFYNGQHRIDALLLAAKMAQKAGIPFAGVPLYFTFGVPSSARYAEDSGIKRSTKQKLRYLGFDQMTDQTTAVLRAMIQGATRKNSRITDSEIGVFYKKYEDVVQWATHSIAKPIRSDVHAALARAALWFGKEEFQPFCEHYKQMVFKEENDPAAVLYKYIVQIRGKTGVSGVTVYRKTNYALDAFLSDRKIFKLRERETDFFEWLPGWEVPTKD